MHKAEHIEAALKRTVGAKAGRKCDIEQQELEFIRKQMLLDQGGEQLSQINFTEALPSTLLEWSKILHAQLEAPVTEEPNMCMNVDSDEIMVDKETQTEELNATFSVSDAETHNEEFAVFPVLDTEALTEEFDYMSVCPSFEVLHRSKSWTLTIASEKQLDGCYTGLLCTVLNISWNGHLSNIELCGDLPPFLTSLQTHHLQLSGLCRRSKNEIVSHFFFEN